MRFLIAKSLLRLCLIVASGGPEVNLADVKPRWRRWLARWLYDQSVFALFRWVKGFASLEQYAKFVSDIAWDSKSKRIKAVARKVQGIEP